MLGGTVSNAAWATNTSNWGASLSGGSSVVMFQPDCGRLNHAAASQRHWRARCAHVVRGRG